VLIPHLLFAHMMADYVLQSNWLVARKRSWDGLLLHGGIVGFMSMLVLAPYLKTVWLALLVLTALHTTQDYLKIYSGPRLAIHSFIPYMIDQLMHYTTIVGIQLWVGDKLSPPPDSTELAFMWTGAAVVTLTRAYEITWWANWLDMLPYMNRWRKIAYTERIAMLALAAVGLWFIAPLCLVPRLVIANRRGCPIWKQKRGLLEMGIGAVLSIVFGIGLHLAYTRI
jgi:hypothetical protein